MKRKWMMLVFVFFMLFLFLPKGEREGQKQMESVLPWKKDQKQVGKGIRVLIKNNGFKNITHAEVKVSSEKELFVIYGDQKISIEANEIQEFRPDHPWFQEGNEIHIKSTEQAEIIIHTVERGCGIAKYRGTIDLYATAEGIVIVNDLPVEEYLKRVVPSEMPAAYEMEALKAQAVCARSYAYRQMESLAYPEYGAHVDDSTLFQVYGNSAEHERTTRAVEETKGAVLYYQGEMATAYFFSTSCGKTTGIEAWNVEKPERYGYLQSISVCDETGVDYEKGLPWYRWSVCVSKNQLKNIIELDQKVELGELRQIEILKTGAGGVVIELKVTGAKGEVVIKNENKIRKALGDSSYQITRNDGSVVNGSDLLPSAFFSLKLEGEQYVIQGGGYGHGIGMSQNGANEMAKRGLNYKEVLNVFYDKTDILYVE